MRYIPKLLYKVLCILDLCLFVLFKLDCPLPCALSPMLSAATLNQQVRIRFYQDHFICEGYLL